MYYVYALYSEKYDRLYIGMTNNINRRLYEHNKGRMKSTKAYIPWEIIFFKKVSSRLEARNLEKKFKTGFGREFLRSKI